MKGCAWKRRKRAGGGCVRGVRCSTPLRFGDDRTGAMEKKMYGLPPSMALDFASSYLLSKARLSLAEMEIKKMQNMGKPTNLVEQMADLLIKG